MPTPFRSMTVQQPRCNTETIPTKQDGRPVYIEKLGKIDLNQMYKISTLVMPTPFRSMTVQQVSSSLPALREQAGRRGSARRLVSRGF
jgi:hypothetical protein